MATFEERLTELEQEFKHLRLYNGVLKNLTDIQSMALRSSSTKSELTKVSDTSSIFDILISQNQSTNKCLGDIQTQILELDSKIVGIQAEMCQSFAQQEITMNTRFDQIMLVIAALAPKPDQGT